MNNDAFVVTAEVTYGQFHFANAASWPLRPPMLDSKFSPPRIKAISWSRAPIDVRLKLLFVKPDFGGLIQSRIFLWVRSEFVKIKPALAL